MENNRIFDGKGTTTEISKYSFVDNPISQGLNNKVYYRLKQVDYNGQFTYTRELEVDLSNIVYNYSLSQNYPNPFNPSTKIKFTLPFDSNVKLSIYNIAGELVKEMIDGYYLSGEHEVIINLNDIKGTSSGVYIYTINAVSVHGQRSFQQTKKMVLLK